MTKFIMIMALLFSCACLAADPNIADLQNSITHQNQLIERLKKDLASAKKEVASLKTENQKLNELCSAAGLLPTEPIESAVYNGKPRTRAWLDRTYKEFMTSIIKFQTHIEPNATHYFMRHEWQEYFRLASNIALEKGNLRNLSYFKVLSVIGDGELLLKMSPVNGADVIVHVTGLSGRYVDNESIGSFPASYVGEYKYTASNGSSNTVASYIVYKFSDYITYDEFLAALRDGITLKYSKKTATTDEMVWVPVS